MDLEKSHSQLEIRLAFVSKVESTQPLIYSTTHVKRWMRRHPAFLEQAVHIGARPPIADDLAWIALIHVHQVGITGLDIWVAKDFSDAAKNMPVCEDVISVKEPDHVTCCDRYALIHGVVDTTIWLGDQMRDPSHVLPDHFRRAVGGGAVDDDVLHMRVVLGGDGADGIRDGPRGIACHGDGGNLERRGHQALNNERGPVPRRGRCDSAPRKSGDDMTRLFITV